MSLDTFFANLKSRLAEMTAPTDRLGVIAEEIAVYFTVRPHEIGLFSVDAKKHEITFRWPVSMATVGHIPLNAVNSLVAKTANERLSSLDNAFARTRHLFMFEHMLADKAERITAQKVMSAPIISGDVVTGVIQVVRKGASPVEAGDDFTQQNLADLERIATVLGHNRV
ncbi:MAG TPA: hypothetical protein VFF53_02300 [Geobacteraceae bacterium]|nr:hypothetical protein [Geobacteraceae bacterium]